VSIKWFSESRYMVQNWIKKGVTCRRWGWSTAATKLKFLLRFSASPCIDGGRAAQRLLSLEEA
jgi:hypothetical protein